MSEHLSHSQEDQVPHAKDSRTTPLDTPTQLSLVKMFRKRAVRLGYLMFLQNRGRLSPGQLLFLLREQDSIRLEELESAITLFGKLVASPRSAARAHRDIEYTLMNCPSLDLKSRRREQRRIGVGYRDKGSLRLPHEDHKVLPRMWWSTDIAPALWTVPQEPRWLTTGEVYMGPSYLRTIQELALLQVLNNSYPRPDLPY
jgi:hypothetical protein